MLNIGLFFVPVAGGAKLAATTSRTMRAGVHSAEFVVPGGSHLLAGTARTIRLTSDGLTRGWQNMIEGIRAGRSRPAPAPATLNAADAGTIADGGRIADHTPVSDALGLRVREDIDTPSSGAHIDDAHGSENPLVVEDANSSGLAEYADPTLETPPVQRSWSFDDPQVQAWKNDLELAIQRKRIVGYDPTAGMGWERFLEEYFVGFDSDGYAVWNWPPDPPHMHGFLDGISARAALKQDTVIERLAFLDEDGNPKDGKFAAPVGTEIGAISVPPDRLGPGTVKVRYRLVGELPENVRMGTAARGFGQSGGGLQYYFPDGIQELVDLKILEPI